MISVSEALARIFELAPPPDMETVPLGAAFGRVLLADAVATRDQPPFASSAMDGYAVRNSDIATGASLRVIGESAAGSRFAGMVAVGEAVRIFTGAPVPDGADRVIIQEDVTRDADRITVGADLDTSSHVRPAGGDFRAGQKLAAPRRLKPADVSLLASMNVPDVTVARRPVVAIIASGDELVRPGETPGPDQIMSSNSFAIAAIAQEEGAETRMLPIARDNAASIRAVFSLAADADLIVTSGGASVGDYDLIGPVAAELGMKQSFYKVAMRPGKPLMAGQLGRSMILGLPGNPVSSIVCSHVFMRPLLRAMQGLPARPRNHSLAPLAAPLDTNGPREHYMRATISEDGRIAAAARQDSSLLSVLSGANALIVREPGAPAARAGEMVEFIPI